MAQLDLTCDGDVFVLRMHEGENRFSPAFLDRINDLLDEVEHADGPRALVTTGEGKFYSNGLDLDWLGAHADETNAYLDRVHGLLARMLAFPVPTVVAGNGHTYAAGLMLALGHDVRVMRQDRGYLCLPEVSIGLPFTPGMAGLVQAKLPVATAHEAMTTGRRYGGEEAAAGGIVDETAAEDQVLPRAMERAAALTTTAGPILGSIKRVMYAPALAALAQPSTL